ncbi:MAG: HEAT repeat domain-containing protein [Sedimentisphaerales bacterium]|nr:HEAT repeat domain-containing protein [Sedimentisphaerales bacterium]
MKVPKMQLSAEIALLFWLIWPVVAVKGEQKSLIYKEFRQLSWKELNEARDARNAADLKLQKCKDLYLKVTPEDFAHLAKDPNWLDVKPRSLQEINDFKEVISDYQNIVNKYEGTEIAAYCRHNISAAYQFQRKYDEAIKQAKITAEMFAGTTYETRSYNTIGLIYLQGLHDPKNAIEWFYKIPNHGSMSKGIEPDQYNKAVSTYISAQQSIIRCEIELGRVKIAQRRVEGLSQKFPQQKENLERDFRMHLDTELEKRFRIDNRDRMEYVLKSPEFLEDAIAKLDSDNNTQEYELFPENTPEKKQIMDVDSKISYTVNDLITEIKSSINTQKLSEKCKGILKELQKQDIDCEKALHELYKQDGIVQERTQIINALQALGTGKSKEILIEIAFNPGMTANTLGPRAVKALSAITDDSTMISRCLESPNAQTKDVAAQELAGKKLSPPAVSRLGELLKTDSWITHNLVTTAFKTDTSDQTNNEKINLLLNAIPGIDKVITLHKDGTLVELMWNSREMVRLSYISAFVEMRDADTNLRNALAIANPEQRTILVIALGLRKHKDMRPEILNIIKTTQDDLLRTMAVESLSFIGTKEDIPMLRQLASSDSCRRSYISDTQGQMVSYPVREAAEQAIKVIQTGMLN